MVMDRRESEDFKPGLDAAVFAQTPTMWLGTVAGLLEEQRELCVRLERLGAEQSRHVGAGHTEGLLTVLNQRQTVLDRVVEINDLLEPFRSNRDAAMARLGANERETLQRRIDQIADSVDRVRRRDDEDRRLLENQRKVIADELTSLNRLRGAAAAYAGAAAAAYRGHDQRG
jgi:hypothetical protein